MSKQMEVPVDYPEGHERIVLVTEYEIDWGRPAILNRAPEDCSPAEGISVNDVAAVWLDNRVKLTGSEYELHQQVIEDAIIEQASDGGYDD
jgi:hypothetical protein